MSSGMHLLVKCPFFYFDFHETWTFSTVF